MNGSQTLLDSEFVGLSRSRWVAFQQQLVGYESLTQQLSLLVRALGHDVRQDLHLLQAAIRAEQSIQPRSPSSAGRVQGLIGRLTKRCEQAVAATHSKNTTLDPLITGAIVVQPLLADVCAYWQGVAEQKGIMFELQAPNITIDTSGFWLSVIVSNLVSNAVNHTSKGRIGVDFCGDSIHWELTVTDTGSGFALESGRALSEYDQRPSPDAGLGCGLQIAKQATAFLGHSFSISTGIKGTLARVSTARGWAFRLPPPKVGPYDTVA